MFWFWKQQDAFDEFVWRETVAKENEHGGRWRTTSSWAASFKAQTDCETGIPDTLGTCSSWEAVQVEGTIDKMIFSIPLFDLYVHV